MLEGLQGDILCLQETKVSRDMLTEPVALVKGFSSYFAFSRRRCRVTCHLALDTWSPDTLSPTTWSPYICHLTPGLARLVTWHLVT